MSDPVFLGERGTRSEADGLANLFVARSVEEDQFREKAFRVAGPFHNSAGGIELPRGLLSTGGALGLWSGD